MPDATTDRAGHPAWERDLAIQEASPHAIIAIDDRGTITYANPRVVQTFGYASADLVGQPVETLLPPAVAEEHVGLRAGFFAHPTARPMGLGLDLAARRRDGTEFPVEISLSPVEGADGLQVFATIVDITERKQAEERLEESERHVRAVLEAAPNAIVAVDVTGVIVYANPRVADTFGFDPGELMGQRIEVLLPVGIAERHVGHRDAFLAHPSARPMGIGMDLAARRQDGTEFPVEISLAPVTSTTGLLVYATVVDITERKATEAQLLQAQKMESIGRLAGGIAHDFNNMLFAIRGYCEILTEDLAGGFDGLTAAGISKQVAAINDAAERATALTTQLLAFSRRQVVRPRIVDVQAAVESLSPMLRSLIGEHIRLTERFDDDGATIAVDPGQFDQILLNLAVNARDAMPDGGTIAIESRSVEFEAADVVDHVELAPGHYVVIAVSDSGIGMDAETRDRAFEPFFTTKEAGKGTGLGLATIYGIVRQSGGHVWLYSEPAMGTTVKMYFPRTMDAPVPPADPSRTSAPIPGSALVVEDDAAVREVTTRMLERAGFQVVAVPDPRAALEAFAAATAPIDVVVTDVVMPGMSGIKLAEHLLRADEGVGVVLLSGYTEEALDVEASAGDRTVFVGKPATSRQLLEAVQRARRRR